MTFDIWVQVSVHHVPLHYACSVALYQMSNVKLQMTWIVWSPNYTCNSIFEEVILRQLALKERKFWLFLANNDPLARIMKNMIDH